MVGPRASLAMNVDSQQIDADRASGVCRLC
jgi:hypothetical protein